MVIWVSKVRTRWMFVVPTILLVPSPRRKRVISNKVFLLLIPRCSASSLMLSIGTNEIGLTHNTQPRYNLSFNTTIKNGNIASEVALIEDTRQKELFYFETSPSTSVDFFPKFFRITCLYRKTYRK